MKKIFLLVILLMSCSGPSLKYKNKTNLKEIKRDFAFEKEIEHFGAYYNVENTIIENYTETVGSGQNTQYIPTISYTVHRQMIVLNKSGYDYAKIYIPKDRKLTDLKIQIMFSDSTIKKLRERDLKKIAYVQNEDYDANFYNSYALPKIGDNSVIDYSYRFSMMYAKYRSDVLILNPEIPIFRKSVSIVNPVVKSGKRVSRKRKKIANTTNRTFRYYNKFPSYDPVRAARNSQYEFVINKIIPEAKEKYAVSKFYTKPMLHYGGGVIWDELYERLAYSDDMRMTVKGYFNLKFNKVDAFKKDKKAFILNWFKENQQIKLKEDEERPGYYPTDMIREAKNENEMSMFNYLLNDEAYDKDKYFIPASAMRQGGSEYELMMLFFLFNDYAELEPEFVLAKSYNEGELNYNDPNINDISAIFIKVGDDLFVPYRKHLNLNELPIDYYGTNAVVLSKNGSKAYKIPELDWKQNGFDWTVDIDMTKANADINAKLHFKDAYSTLYKSMRYYFKEAKSDSTDELSFVQNNVNSWFSNIEVKRFEFYEDDSKNRGLNLSLLGTQIIEKLGDEYVFNLGSLISSNYSSLIDLNDRKFDFDFKASGTFNYSINVIIPDGFTIDDIESHNFYSETDFFSQDMKISLNDNKLTIRFKNSIKQRIVKLMNKDEVESFAKNISNAISKKLLLRKK